MNATASAKAYLDLCRVSNLPTVWTNVLAASLLADPIFQANRTLLLAVSLSCFYVAGMALNDLCDREYDRLHRPSRPIASGKIEPEAARIFVLTLFVTGFLLLSLAPHAVAVLVAVLLFAAIVSYDLHHKQNLYSVFLMASCRMLVFLLAGLAVAGELPVEVVMAGTLQFGYIVLLSLIARAENSRPRPFPFPVVPLMLAGISLLDGGVLAVSCGTAWGAAGVAGFLLTLAGQRYVRGD